MSSVVLLCTAVLLYADVMLIGTVQYHSINKYSTYCISIPGPGPARVRHIPYIVCEKSSFVEVVFMFLWSIRSVFSALWRQFISSLYIGLYV
jgi:hypothetical protein